jgi:phospholipase D1/2
VPLAAGRVSIARTDPQGSPSAAACCREICDLYLDAIASAERSIYIETQYFSSHEVSSALAARLLGPGTLDVVLVLNMEAETLKEQIAVGLAQAQILDKLRRAALGTSHRLGIYYTVPHTDVQDEPARATYIHSKVMFVDDRFMTVGSANLTNRSMGVDTELNVSVESESEDDELGRSITRARQNLLCEHLGVDSSKTYEDGELVRVLDGLAARKQGRLRLHPSPTPKELALLSVVDPQKLPFDPAALEDDDHRRSLFSGGLRALWNRSTSTVTARVGR